MADPSDERPSTTRLDPDKLLETLRRLRSRIGERFPDSSLSRVCDELLSVASRTRSVSAWIERPSWSWRLLALVFALGLVGVTVYAVSAVELPDTRRLSLEQFITILEAAMNDVVLIGAAVFFVVTMEGRVKRGRALSALHELRSVAHIIDMHQLTKDPDRLLARERRTTSSPDMALDRFELGRYLDYCSEMLSLTGKIAALYVQSFRDPVAVATVNEVEGLCTGLSRKIWQKLMILETLPLEEDGPQAKGSQPAR